MASRNGFDRFVQQCVCVVGQCSGAAVLSELSGDLIADQANVSVTTSGTGIFAIAITNFRGQRNSGTTRLIGFGTGTTLSNSVTNTSAAYNAGTDTAVFTFKVYDDTGTAQNNGFNFMCLAY